MVKQMKSFALALLALSFSEEATAVLTGNLADCPEFSEELLKKNNIKTWKSFVKKPYLMYKGETWWTVERDERDWGVDAPLTLGKEVKRETTDGGHIKIMHADGTTIEYNGSPGYATPTNALDKPVIQVYTYKDNKKGSPIKVCDYFIKLANGVNGHFAYSLEREKISPLQKSIMRKDAFNKLQDVLIDTNSSS